MQFKNLITKITIGFPPNTVKYRMLKVLKEVDDTYFNSGSFYHMVNDERKRMGNWVINYP